MAKYEIGFGPLNGPGESIGGLSTAIPKPVLPGGKTQNAPRPTPTTLTIGNLAITAVPYLGVHAHLEARATVTWDAPPAGESDTEVNQVKNYDIHWSTGSGYGPDTRTQSRSVVITGLPVLKTLTVQVRSHTGSGVYGPWATASITTPDTTVPPPVPSAPTVFGTMRGGSMGWDGLFAANAPRPDDFLYVEGQLSLAADFSNAVTPGRLHDQGSTAVVELGHAPFTLYGRFRARNRSGVYSAWSATGQGGSIPIIAADIGQGQITLGKINQGAVDAYAIAEQAVGNYALGPGAVHLENVIDGAISAAKTNLPAIDSNSGTLAINAVHATNMIADGIIIGSHILGRQIDATNILSKVITSNEVHALTLTSNEIMGTSITADSVALNTLTAQQIGTGAIQTDELDSYAVTSKYVTGGTIRTKTAGSDRVEMVDTTVYDYYLGYSRSISDTIRWIRGYDGAIAAEVRGYMGDIGAYGLHLNSDLELGNVQSTIYQVGKRKASNGASQGVRVRAGHGYYYLSGGGFSVGFDGPMSQAPTFVLATVSTGSTSEFVTWRVRSFSQYGFYMDLRYVSSDTSKNGLAPGDGAYYYVSWYAEIVV